MFLGEPFGYYTSFLLFFLNIEDFIVFFTTRINASLVEFIRRKIECLLL